MPALLRPSTIFATSSSSTPWAVRKTVAKAYSWAPLIPQWASLYPRGSSGARCMNRTVSARSKTPATPPPPPPPTPPPPSGQDLSALLAAMQAVRDGDFSVRLPGRLDRPARQDRRHLQRDRRRQRQHGARARAGRHDGRQAGQDPPARPVRVAGRRLGRDGDVGQHADRRPAAADHRGDARPRGRRQGRPARRPCASTSTAGRSRASSCARRPSSTR